MNFMSPVISYYYKDILGQLAPVICNFFIEDLGTKEW